MWKRHDTHYQGPGATSIHQHEAGGGRLVAGHSALGAQVPGCNQCCSRVGNVLGLRRPRLAQAGRHKALDSFCFSSKFAGAAIRFASLLLCPCWLRHYRGDRLCHRHLAASGCANAAAATATAFHAGSSRGKFGCQLS